MQASIRAEIRIGVPGTLCSLHRADGSVIAVVRTAGRRFNVYRVAAEREALSSSCDSYATARGAMLGLVPAQDGCGR